MRAVLCTLICFLLVLLFACNNGEIRDLRANLSTEQAKVSLLQNSDSDALITKIDSFSVPGQFVVHYTNSSTTSISKNILSAINTDAARWVTTFLFDDGSQMVTPTVGALNLGDSIKVNPYGTSPLCALAKFTLPVSGRFNVIVHGKPNGGVSISHNFTAIQQSQELGILGLYENYANQVELQMYNKAGTFLTSETVTLQTTAISGKPTINIKSNHLAATDQSIYSVSAAGAWGFDQTGELRWYYSGDSFWVYGKLINGNFITSLNAGMVNGHAASLNEVSMLGQLIKNYVVPNFQHHEVFEMPNGNLLVGTNSAPPPYAAGQTWEDEVAEIDRSSGVVIKSWNMNNILDPDRLTLPDAPVPLDWCHLNRVFYHQSDNSLIISSRSQCAVVKIDYQTGAIKWILSNPKAWNAQLSAYLLTPVNTLGVAIDVSGTDFWPYGQHHPWQLDNGNILLYDDGDYRNFYDDNTVPLVSYSRAVEYQIDETNKTIQLVWSFDNNKSLFTQYTGSAERFSNTNTTMIGYMDGGPNATGDTPKILEIDSGNNTVFEADVNVGNFYYRAIKMDLYNGIN